MKTHRKLLNSLIGLTLFIFAFNSYSASADYIDTSIRHFQKNISDLSARLSGSIILVSDKNHRFYYASQNVTTDSQFYIGSLTKQMTAYILLNVLQQKYPNVDLNQLLNQKLSTLFPYSEFLKEINKPWINEVTLLDLLTHQSGLSDYIDYYQNEIKNPQLLNYPINPIAIVKSVKFDYRKPYQYSNTNYFIVGKLLEEIEQSSFDRIYNRLISSQAGMRYSEAPILHNYHYLKNDNRFANLIPDLNNDIFMDMNNAIGAGNAVSSAIGLLKWNDFFYNNSNTKIRKIMLTNYLSDEDNSWVNLGLTTEISNFGKFIGFQGGQDSYHSFLGYLPNQQLTIIILSNNQEDFETLMDALGNFLYGNDSANS